MVYASFDIEKQLWNKNKTLICGIDEVGRGCFAGPVVVGAVIFPQNSQLIKGIADSKLLKPKVREELSLAIKELALAWTVSEVDVPTINKVGIGKATQIAFKKAVETLSQFPDHILIDAFYIDELNKDNQTSVKHGDSLSASIAAASIIAKVYRDELMTKLHDRYPQYGFSKHKGYGTKEHQEAIKKYGLSKIHRTSFDLAKFL